MLIGENIMSRILNGLAINFEKFKLFLFAYIFGSISPNNKIKNVIKNTSIKKTKSIFKSKKKRDTLIVQFPNNFSEIDANKITIPIFMKLFATKIVANNFWGEFKSLAIVFFDLELLSLNESISDLVKENKATSAPEIKAEQISKNKSNAIDKTVVSVSNLKD